MRYFKCSKLDYNLRNLYGVNLKNLLFFIIYLIIQSEIDFMLRPKDNEYDEKYM